MKSALHVTYLHVSKAATLVRLPDSCPQRSR